MAIIAGFTGVLIVVRPGPEGFSFAALVCVFSMLTAAIRDLSTKRINRDVPAIFVSASAAGRADALPEFVQQTRLAHQERRTAHAHSTILPDKRLPRL